MKAIIFFGIMLPTSVAAMGQSAGRIAGVVRQNGRTVQNATVQALNINVRGAAPVLTASDSNGAFEFTGLTPGQYRVIAEGEKGKGTAVAVLAVEGIDPTGVDLDLTMAAYELLSSQFPINEVVTIAADLPQSVNQVSKSVNTISGQEMRERADLSLVDSLRTVPGFRVQQLGGFGRTSSIKARGMRNSDTAVLMDGIRFRDASAITGDTGSFLSDITLTSVNRVEALRGPGSSLYGTNAIAGTVNFVTPLPQSGFHGQLSGAWGGLGLQRYRANLSDGTSNGKFGFNLGVSRTLYNKGIDGDDDAHNTNFQNRLEFSPGRRTNLSVRFFVSDAFVKLNTNPQIVGPIPASDADPVKAIPLAPSEIDRYLSGTPVDQLDPGPANFIPDVNDPDNSQRSRAFQGQVVFSHTFNSQLSLQAYYQGLRTSRNNTNGVLGVGFQPFSGGDEKNIFAGQIHTANAHFDWTPGETQQITAGFEYEFEKFRNENITLDPTQNFSARVDQRGNTFYVQDVLSLADRKLQIAGGFRFQTFRLGTPRFTPTENPTYSGREFKDPPSAYTGDASVSYFFSRTMTKLRVHAGNGYRVPSLYERFGSSYFFGSFSSSGDPNLKPERTAAFDAGIDQSFLGAKGKISAVYFYTDVITAIDFALCLSVCLPKDDPLGRFVGYYNTKGRVSRGLETSIEFRPSNSTSVFGSYTFTNSDERNPLNPALAASPGIPSHQVTAAITQRIASRLALTFDLTATSSYLFPFFFFTDDTQGYLLYRFKGSKRGDITARYEHPMFRDTAKFVIHGTIENVFGDKYFENGFRTVGRTARIGLGFSF
ncbi:MAG: TonB-dependent receptor [Acidobacteriota bacterium]